MRGSWGPSRGGRDWSGGFERGLRGEEDRPEGEVGLECLGVVSGPTAARVAVTETGDRPFVRDDQTTPCGFPGTGTSKSPSAGFRGLGWVVPLTGCLGGRGTLRPRAGVGSGRTLWHERCLGMSACGRSKLESGRCSSRGEDCEPLKFFQVQYSLDSTGGIE